MKWAMEDVTISVMTQSEVLAVHAIQGIHCNRMVILVLVRTYVITTSRSCYSMQLH